MDLRDQLDAAFFCMSVHFLQICRCIAAALIIEMAVCVQTYGADNFKSELYAMNTPLDFSDRRYIADIETEGNCLVGCFDRAEDEAYMLANYGYPDETQAIELTITLKGGATHLAVYGGDGYSGTPEVIAAQDGKVTLSIAPGDGKFVVPLL